MFTAAQRKKAHSPAARRKAVKTWKRTLARKRKALRAQGGTVFNVADLPARRPVSTYDKAKRGKAGMVADRVQLARDLITLISQLVK